MITPWRPGTLPPAPARPRPARPPGRTAGARARRESRSRPPAKQLPPNGEVMASDRAEVERAEWCFEFHVSSDRPVHQSEADRLMDEAIHWAEAHRLGVGGSYEPASAEVNNACCSWAFRFGLCASEDEQLISRESASDLWDLL